MKAGLGNTFSSKSMLDCKRRFNALGLVNSASDCGRAACCVVEDIDAMRLSTCGI